MLIPIKALSEICCPAVLAAVESPVAAHDEIY